MTEATTTTAATTAGTTAGTTAAPPWYEGKADAETIGYWQNRGLDPSDPGRLAIETTKAAREAQKFVGVPADRLLRLPEKPDDAGWKDVWSKLGAPAEAKDYDFSAVKSAAGEPIDARLADALRAEFHARHVPKDAAAEIARAVLKHNESVGAEQAAVRAAKLAEEKAALAQSWGPNKDFNHLKAMEGARRLGIAPEAIQALENQIGYKAVMEAMRKIGTATSEDTFHEGGSGPGGTPATREGAAARLAELRADDAWGKRLLAGDAATVREWQSLETLAAGLAA